MTMKFKDRNYRSKEIILRETNQSRVDNIICTINLVLFRNITMFFFSLHPYETGVEGHLHAME